MREYFWKVIHELMREDERIVILMSDTGFKVLDDIREEFGKSRCFDVGIAEQNMISVAAGMATEGLRPICYAIAPFATLRCFEQIRDDICINELDVKIVGIGAGFDYHMLGSTHHADNDIALMRSLPNMMIYQPSDKESTKILAERMMDNPYPCYFRLSRYGQESLYRKKRYYYGCQYISGDNECMIITSGVILEEVLKAVDIIQRGTNPPLLCSVIDVSCLKGYDLDICALLGMLVGVKNIFTVEEHSILGGLGDLISGLVVEYMTADSMKCSPIKRIGMQDAFLRKYGSREYLLRQTGLHAECIAVKILENFPDRRIKPGIEVYGATNQYTREREAHIIIGKVAPNHIKDHGLGYFYIVHDSKLNGIKFHSIDGVRQVIGELESMIENAKKSEE